MFLFVIWMGKVFLYVVGLERKKQPYRFNSWYASLIIISQNQPTKKKEPPQSSESPKTTMKLMLVLYLAAFGVVAQAGPLRPVPGDRDKFNNNITKLFTISTGIHNATVQNLVGGRYVLFHLISPIGKRGGCDAHWGERFLRHRCLPNTASQWG